MKKIEEMYQEILQNAGLKGEFVQAAKDNQLEAFLQKNDCNATLAELQEFAKKRQDEILFLSDTELDAAAGGIIGADVIITSILTHGQTECADETVRTARGKGSDVDGTTVLC